MIRAYQIIDGKEAGKVPEKKRKNGMEIIGREKMEEVKETNEKTPHTYVYGVFFVELRRQDLNLRKPTSKHGRLLSLL